MTRCAWCLILLSTLCWLVPCAAQYQVLSLIHRVLLQGDLTISHDTSMVQCT